VTSRPRPGGPVQLDLFGEVDAALAARRAQAAADLIRQQLLVDFEAIKHRHPGTGKDLGTRMWCGRCGAVEVNDFLIVINHELGWCAGCYIRHRPGTLDSPFAHLTEQQQADRWDRLYFADCAGCGHPWGLHCWDIGGGSHDTNIGCHALLTGRCDCPGYRPGQLPGRPADAALAGQF